MHGLLEDRDAALGIASFLESRFKLMLEGRKLMDGGLSAQTAAAKLEGNRYANTKACTAAKNTHRQSLRSLSETLQTSVTALSRAALPLSMRLKKSWRVLNGDFLHKLLILSIPNMSFYS